MGNTAKGHVDMATGRVTDAATGRVYSWQEWAIRKDMVTLAAVTAGRAARDPASDMQALWGTKPYFVDDWWNGYVPSFYEPNPNQSFGRGDY